MIFCLMYNNKKDHLSSMIIIIPTDCNSLYDGQKIHKDDDDDEERNNFCSQKKIYIIMPKQSENKGGWCPSHQPRWLWWELLKKGIEMEDEHEHFTCCCCCWLQVKQQKCYCILPNKNLTPLTYDDDDYDVSMELTQNGV